MIRNSELTLQFKMYTHYFVHINTVLTIEYCGCILGGYVIWRKYGVGIGVKRKVFRFDKMFKSKNQ